MTNDTNEREKGELELDELIKEAGTDARKKWEITIRKHKEKMRKVIEKASNNRQIQHT